MKRILVVEDDIMLNSGLCYNLELDGYRAVPVYNGAAALNALEQEGVDLVILDVNLPDEEGFSLCAKIKERRDVPVLFLTARDLEADVLKGFELGAEDYITKPFNVNILRKKVSAVLKRWGGPVRKELYTCGDLTVDFERLTASVKEKPLLLTPGEFKILRLFTDHPEILLTRQVLLERLYDADANFVDEHALTVLINRLRGKIETESCKYIKTVYGMGYIWMGDRR